MKNNYRRNIGSVSHGTMRPEDLIPDFIWELRQMKPLYRRHGRLISEITRRMVSCRCEVPCKGKRLRENEEVHLDQYFDSSDAVEDLASLFEALDEYALPYFYFGAHLGDGSDFGYWLSEDFAAFSDAYGFDGIRVSDLSEVPVGYTGEVLHINDHGNMSLYAYSRGKGREIWAVV